MLEAGDLMELVFKPGLGIGQEFIRRDARRVCRTGLRGHKWCKNMLDNGFSLADKLVMKIDMQSVAFDKQ